LKRLQNELKEEAKKLSQNYVIKPEGKNTPEEE